MCKTKKGGPIHKDDDSLVEQVPDNKMATLTDDLVKLAEQKQAQSLAEGSILDTDTLINSPQDLPKLRALDSEEMPLSFPEQELISTLPPELEEHLLGSSVRETIGDDIIITLPDSCAPNLRNFKIPKDEE